MQLLNFNPMKLTFLTLMFCLVFVIMSCDNSSDEYAGTPYECTYLGNIKGDCLKPMFEFSSNVEAIEAIAGASVIRGQYYGLNYAAIDTSILIDRIPVHVALRKPTDEELAAAHSECNDSLYNYVWITKLKY